MVTPQIEVSDNPQLTDLVQQLASQTAIGLTLHGEEKAVVLSVKAFQSLLGLEAASPVPQTLKDLSLQAQTAIAANGYTSREKILALIQTVKQELAIDRDQHLANRHPQA